jgi:hypothetical protein
MGTEGFSRCAVTVDLELAPDNGDRARQHGVLQPLKVTPLASYQAALEATRDLWKVDEPEEAKP